MKRYTNIDQQVVGLKRGVPGAWPSRHFSLLHSTEQASDFKPFDMEIEMPSNVSFGR